MKTLKPCITILGTTAFLLASAGMAVANDTADSPGGFFDRPLLSRLIPGSEESRKEDGGGHKLPSRFSLGFFTTKAAPEDDNFFGTPYPGSTPPPQMTALADIGYGSYYGASRVDTNRPALVTGLAGMGEFSSSSKQNPEDNLSLSLEAGMRHQGLNTGVLYAYQSGYPARKDATARGGTPYPSYIFTPLQADYGPDLEAQNPEGHAVFLYLGYNHSPQLNLRGTLGLARTGTSGEQDELSYNEQSKRWGLDFAATYKLLDNLVYEAHLGYVNIDDASAPSLPTLPAAESATQSNPDQDADSLYHIGSHIRMTF